jgi:hypothetical protein
LVGTTDRLGGGDTPVTVSEIDDLEPDDVGLDM